jgi:hypothetical protein
MKIHFFTLLLLLSIKLYSAPYQLIESESATMIKKNNLEYKVNGVYETGYIPVGLMRLGLRYGIVSHLEGFVMVDGGQFIDQEETRVTAVSGTLKYHFWRQKFFNLNIFAYGKYKHMFGDAIIVPYESTDSEMEDVAEVVSPHADEGRDASVGILGRNSIRLFRRNYVYMIGLEYTRAMNRDYGDFEDSHQNMGSLMFVPEYHFGKNDYVMLAFENKISYWHERGYMYSAMPQLRWEFISFWVFETGVVIPIVGSGNNYRIIAGFTYGKG